MGGKCPQPRITYRVSHLLIDLKRVYFDLGAQPSCPSVPASSAKITTALAESGMQWNTQNPSQQEVNSIAQPKMQLSFQLSFQLKSCQTIVQKIQKSEA